MLTYNITTWNPSIWPITPMHDPCLCGYQRPWNITEHNVSSPTFLGGSDPKVRQPSPPRPPRPPPALQNTIFFVRQFRNIWLFLMYFSAICRLCDHELYIGSIRWSAWWSKEFFMSLFIDYSFLAGFENNRIILICFGIRIKKEQKYFLYTETKIVQWVGCKI